MPAKLGRYMFETHAFGEHAVEGAWRIGRDYSAPPFVNVPNLATGVNLTASATANTYGSYASLTTGLDRDRLITKLRLVLGTGATPAANNTELTVALAAESDDMFSEMRLVDILSGSTTSNARPVPGNLIKLPFPVFLPAGCQVKARMQTTGAVALQAQLAFEATLPELFGPETLVINPVRRRGQLGYLHLPANAVGTTVTSGANVYGTAVNITAGLARDVYVVAMMAGRSTTSATANTYLHGRVVMGGSNFPVADLPLQACGVSCSATVASHVYSPGFFSAPIFVPRGTSVGVQLASSAALAHIVSLMYIPANELVHLRQVQ